MKMRCVLNPVSKYTLYDKFKSISVPITYYFDIEPITKKNKPSNFTNIPNDGMAHGNVYYTDVCPPHLENSFLRYSCPIY